MNRKGWLIVFVLLLAGLIAATLGWFARQAHPQVVTMPNGVQYEFQGVTYGTNHVMGSRLDLIIARLPTKFGRMARQFLGNRLAPLNRYSTSRPSLCVWLRPLDTNAPSARGLSVTAMLADASGVLAGDRHYTYVWASSVRPRWLRIDFPVLPRRSRMVECRFFTSAPGKHQEFARVQFSNPAFGQYPQWQPEALPVTQKAGDLSVRLERFSTGHNNSMESYRRPNGMSGTRFGRAKPGEEIRAVFQLSFDSPRGTNEVWTLNGAQLSDATGNVLPITGRSDVGNGRFAVAPVLWPDEAAWKLKLELERKSGFRPEELVVFKGVPIPPVGTTNFFSLTTNMDGVEITLTNFSHKAEPPDGSGGSRDANSIQIQHTKMPAGKSFDFVRMTADGASQPEVFGRSWSDTEYTISFRHLSTNASTVDLIYSLQPTRVVEFLVKPEPPADEESGPAQSERPRRPPPRAPRVRPEAESSPLATNR